MLDSGITPGNNFYLVGITKQNYVLADPDAVKCPYSYSASSPMVIVVENPDERQAAIIEATNKIRRTMRAQMQKREEEIEARQDKSEQEKQKLMAELDELRANSYKLISSMAEVFPPWANGT